MKLIYKPKSGHKYFEDEEKRLHIADDSGSTPLETEDGDLIVDFSREITQNFDSTFDFFSIPLITPTGCETSTIGGIHEVLFLVGRGMKIDHDAKILVEEYRDSLSLDFD